MANLSPSPDDFPCADCGRGRRSDISVSSAQFLLHLLNQQQLQIGAPDFDEAVARVMAARAELQAIVGDESAE